MRNQVRSLTRKAKVEHEKSIAREAKTNPKKFWSYAKAKTNYKHGVSQCILDQ